MIYLGSALVEVWEMEDREAEVLACWNQINRDSGPDGINCFLALVMVLREKGYACDMDGFAELEMWTKTAKQLTAGSLKNWMEHHDSECCRRAYQWSELVK